MAVFAIPDKLPTKVGAVMLPETLIVDGNLELFNVPEDILVAFNRVKSDPYPTKLLAVTNPVGDKILPFLSNPTPSTKEKILLIPPTWKANLGSFVATPTLPCEYMLVNPNPTSVSIH